MYQYEHHIIEKGFKFNLTLLLFVVSLLLLHKKNENLSENLNKVNEQVQGVGNKVPVTIASLSDDYLGVKHDKSTENSQTNPNVSLEK